MTYRKTLLLLLLAHMCTQQGGPIKRLLCQYNELHWLCRWMRDTPTDLKSSKGVDDKGDRR